MADDSLKKLKASLENRSFIGGGRMPDSCDYAVRYVVRSLIDTVEELSAAIEASPYSPYPLSDSRVGPLEGLFADRAQDLPQFTPLTLPPVAFVPGLPDVGLSERRRTDPVFAETPKCSESGCTQPAKFSGLCGEDYWKMVACQKGDTISALERQAETLRGDLECAAKEIRRTDRLLNKPEGLRPEVQAFALLMEQKLRENDHKGGWKHDEPQVLLARVCEELVELVDTIDFPDQHRLNTATWHLEQAVLHFVNIFSDAAPATGLEECAKEAADVANMLMMVVDVCGRLKYEKTDE